MENLNKDVCPEENCLFQGDPGLFHDTNINQPNRPLTRALKKLIDYKNAATMAISFLQEDFECPYTFTKITLNIAVTNATMLSRRWIFQRIQTFVKNTEI